MFKALSLITTNSVYVFGVNFVRSLCARSSGGALSRGGATFDREAVVANTRKFICNKVRRELLPATLKVYPIKDYGVIDEDEHRFCQFASGECEGRAKFLIIWQNKGGKWQMMRVNSYGHRALIGGRKGKSRTKVRRLMGPAAY